jgi:hypothetical protein
MKASRDGLALYTMQNRIGERLFRTRRKIIFAKAGIKFGFLFRASLLFVPASQNRTYWEQLRASLWHKEELLLCVLRHD